MPSYYHIFASDTVIFVAPLVLILLVLKSNNIFSARSMFFPSIILGFPYNVSRALLLSNVPFGRACVFFMFENGGLWCPDDASG